MKEDYYDFSESELHDDDYLLQTNNDDELPLDMQEYVKFINKMLSDDSI